MTNSRSQKDPPDRTYLDGFLLRHDLVFKTFSMSFTIFRKQIINEIVGEMQEAQMILFKEELSYDDLRRAFILLHQLIFHLMYEIMYNTSIDLDEYAVLLDLWSKSTNEMNKNLTSDKQLVTPSQFIESSKNQRKDLIDDMKRAIFWIYMVCVNVEDPNSRYREMLSTSIRKKQ